MTELPLERRCRRVVRAYPDSDRRAEVLTTLMECNEGRSAPRLAEVVDVLWHGFVARLRRDPAPGTRFGRFGDLLAVAVVAVVVSLSVTAVVVYSAGVVAPLVSYDPNGMFPLQPYEYLAGAVAAALAVAVAVSACRGRVLRTRLLALAAAATGVGVYATERAIGNPFAFLTWEGQTIIAIGVATVALLLFTDAPARAARVVTTAWWRRVFLTGLLVGRYLVDTGERPFHWGRGALALGVWVVVVGPVVVLAVWPLFARRQPVVAD